MKVKLLLSVLILFAGSLFFSASGQDTINALIEKCKKIDNVDVKVSRYKGKTGNRTETTTINLHDNKDLAAEFIAAFRKDSEKADTSTEREVNDVIVGLQCTFGREYYNYNEEKSVVTISIHKNYSEK